jgi:hypothetical protein
MNYLIPFIIIGITYVNIIRGYDVYLLVITNKFNLKIYSSFDFGFIFLYTLLVTYNISLINVSIKRIYRYIKEYKSYIEIDNMFIKIDYDQKDIKFIENTQCPICYIEYSENKENKENNICQLIQCTHIYHRDCIKKWYIYSNQYSCPTCRSEIIL